MDVYDENGTRQHEPKTNSLVKLLAEECISRLRHSMSLGLRIRNLFYVLVRADAGGGEALQRICLSGTRQF